MTSDLKEKFSRQRVTVRVQSNRWQPEHDVTRRDSMTVNHPVAIDNPDDEAGYIVFAVCIEPRHLGRLAAQQHAAIFTAAVGHAFDDAGNYLRREFPGRDVVEEEQRPRTLYQNVVDAMVH